MNCTFMQPRLNTISLPFESLYRLGLLESDYKTLTKLLPQKRHRCTASRSSSTIQPCAAVGSPFCDVELDDENGKKAFRLHPTQVWTDGVERMKVVIEQRAGGVKTISIRSDRLQVEHVPHICPLPQVAIVISCKGISTRHAGQTSFRSWDTSLELIVCTRNDKFCPSCDRSSGEPGRVDWTTRRDMKGISLAMINSMTEF